MVAPQGIRGEVRVYPDTDFPERFLERRRFFLSGGEGGGGGWAEVEAMRFHRGLVLVKFAGCDTRDQAERLRGALLQVPVAELPPLPEGRYYHHEVVGLRVETPDGQVVGQVEEILSVGPHDVYVVRRRQAGRRPAEHLIPAVRQVVREIDLAGGRMVIDPIPGLLE